jgi:hypothetical protein
LRISPVQISRAFTQRDAKYLPGDFVTDNGSMYHCDAPSRGIKPTDDHTFWTLAVKRGKDATR